MKNINLLWKYLDEHILFVYIFSFLLACLVFLTNLGMLPLFADEPTRALVAIEMMFSDNYWVPTIQGEFYYNKPPLYNWIIAGLFTVTGSMSEFIFRLPSVIPLLLFGLTIFLWAKKKVSSAAAFLGASMFVTCGRILVYASLLGHIDIFYSWLVFLSFIVFIESLNAKNWWRFFVLTYFIASISFLCKGLPTVVFQGLTIITLLLYSKNFKKFFSLAHATGILLFSILVGGYFYMYAQHNSLEGWVSILWEQSAQRTVIDKPWYESLIHIVKFPLEHLYHLAPWSLFVIFLWKKSVRTSIWKNNSLRMLALILIVNIPVYWLSPGYYPRYLFMLYPIVFILLAQAYMLSTELKSKKIIHRIFIGIGGLLALSSIVLPFVSLGVDFNLFKGSVLCVLSLLGVGALVYLNAHKYVGLVLVLITVRLAFSWIIIPAKLNGNRDLEYKTEAQSIGKKTKGERLKAIRSSSLNHSTIFYIERERKEILTHTAGVWPGEFHVASELLVKKHNFQKLDSLSIKFEGRELYLVKAE
ncbi:MAG: hypothetical protein QNK63_10900 [Flavobacteriales bacterium]